MSKRSDAKGWLDLGYLTDKMLALRVQTIKGWMETRAGVRIPMASVIRRLIKSGLEVEEEKMRNDHPR